MTRASIAERTSNLSGLNAINAPVMEVTKQVAGVTVASPALDLQRRLGEAALHGFFKPARLQLMVAKRHVAVAVAAAVASSSGVFAIILILYR